ncbi:MAG: DNA/pantothenate metabolism flavoprotein domain protein, partial [Verrucomicrobia bacterium]|nr:DNA/pantothenate metabolism flavoprotein domain protein [Verrucomicrobiota bacterium]
KLGLELADFLSTKGYRTILLRGTHATYRDVSGTAHIQAFSTSSDLLEQLEKLAGPDISAIFHAAAVADFTFGQIWNKTNNGTPKQSSTKKFDTKNGALLAELLPTPKILSKLRSLFPSAFITGWKFEVDGTRNDVIQKARLQLDENHTNACIANGPAYGDGFGLITKDNISHLQTRTSLFQSLTGLIS